MTTRTATVKRGRPQETKPDQIEAVIRRYADRVDLAHTPDSLAGPLTKVYESGLSDRPVNLQD